MGHLLGGWSTDSVDARTLVFFAFVPPLMYLSEKGDAFIFSLNKCVPFSHH